MAEKGVLIIGGTGFLGRALAQRLSRKPRPLFVSGLDSSLPAIPGVETRLGAMDDRALLNELLPQCSSVVHLACATTPGSSRESPAMETDYNLGPFFRFLEAAGELEQLQLVFVSSGGTVYGNPVNVPVDEAAPLMPRSYHGAAKVAAEMFLNVFANRGGRAVTILRPSNIYGPGQPLRAGFGLVRTLLEHAVQGTTLEIWGDGSELRDYIYVDDVAVALEAALDTPEAPGTYNIGSGVGISLLQMKEIVEHTTGRQIAVRYCAPRGIDVSRIVLDTRRFAVVSS